MLELIGMEILDRFHENRHKIALIDQKPYHSVQELKKKFPHKKICACDFYVEDAQKGKITDYGIEYESILNIDHHAPVEEMRHHISSGVLATRYVKRFGVLDDEWIILINHKDCDSIIGSFILAGILPPEQKFSEAVIHADHTGHDDDIADLLQSIQYKEDLEQIAINLNNLLNDRSIDEEAKKLMKKRKDAREFAKHELEKGNYEKYKDVAYLILDRAGDPTMLIPFLADTKVIMMAYKSPHDSERWNIRIRLGLAAKKIHLNTLDLPDFGGRWNAGSTRRHGGTSIHPKEYAKIIQEHIDNIS